MWIVDSEFDAVAGVAHVVSVMRVRRPDTLRQWMWGEGAAAWLSGRRVAGYNVGADLRVLGLVDGVDVVAWDVWGWLVGQWPELAGASLDDLMRQNLDLNLLIHGRDPMTGRALVGRRLRDASANSVRVVDMLLYVMRVRGGVRFDGRWWPVDVGDLLARLGG